MTAGIGILLGVLLGLVVAGGVGLLGFATLQARLRTLEQASQQLRTQLAAAAHDQEEMGRNEALLQTILANFPAGSINIYDRDYRYLLAQGQGLAAVGMTPGDLEGRTLYELFPPDLVELTVQHYDRAFQGETLSFEFAFAENIYLMTAAPLHRDSAGVAQILVVALDISDRKQAERAVREQDAHYRSLLESADGFGIYRNEVAHDVALKGRTLLASPSLKGILGVENPTNFESWWENIHPQDLPHVLDAQYASVNEHATFNQIMRIFNPQKDMWRWIHAVSNPVVNETGKVTYFNGIIIDVTDQRETEEIGRLQSLIVENISDAILVTDMERRIIECNPAATRLYGYTREEIIGHTPDLFVVPEDRASVAAAIESGADAAGGWTGEINFVRKDGRRGTCETSVILLRDKWGMPVARVGINRDVTERKTAQQALEASEIRYRTLVESSHDLIWEVDIDGTVIFVNDVAWDFYGMEPGELIGRPFTEIMVSDDVPTAIALFQEALSEGNSVIHYENRVVHKDGQVIILDSHAVVRRDASGGIVGIIGTSQDITERKMAENAQRNHIEQMQVLRRLGLNMATELDLDRLLHSIVSESINLAHGRRGGLYLYDPARHSMEWIISIGPDLDPPGRVVDEHAGIAGEVFRSRGMVLIQKYQDWPDRIFEFAQHQHTCILGVPVIWGERFLGVLEVMKEYPETFSDAEKDLLALFATQAATAIQNAQSFEFQRRWAKELEALYRSGLGFSRIQNAAMVGSLILETLEELRPYRRGAIALWDEESAILKLLAHARMGLDDDEFVVEWTRVSGMLAEEESLMKWVTLNGKPARISNVEADSRYLNADEVMRSQLTVPLQIRGRTIGALNVESEQPNAFDEYDERLLTILATQAAVAIENAQLFGQLSEGQERLRTLSQKLVEAQETERRRLARELHDELGQNLSAIYVRVMGGIGRPAKEMSQTLQEIATVIEGTVDMVRDMSLALRPGMLDDFGLESALQWLIRRMESVAKLTIHYESNLATRRLSPSLEITGYRIVQEALTNITRHAEANQVWVWAQLDDDSLRLSIRDDGVGFAMEPVLGPHADRTKLGLLGMRERVALHHGHIEFDTAPGRGCQIHATLPVH